MIGRHSNSYAASWSWSYLALELGDKSDHAQYAGSWSVATPHAKGLELVVGVIECQQFFLQQASTMCSNSSV